MCRKTSGTEFRRTALDKINGDRLKIVECSGELVIYSIITFLITATNVVKNLTNEIMFIFVISNINININIVIMIIQNVTKE